MKRFRETSSYIIRVPKFCFIRIKVRTCFTVKNRIMKSLEENSGVNSATDIFEN